MDALARLRVHRQSAGCQFVRARQCFVYDGVQRRGLTRVLDSVHSIPAHNRSTCAGCAERRRSTSQFSASAAGFRSRVGPVFQSRKQQRRGDADLIVVSPAASVAVSTPEMSRCRGQSATAHGIAVDRDVQATVKLGTGRPPRTADPCCLSLLAYIRVSLHWRPVASQVPIYSSRGQFATAIDLLCVDEATRSKLYVVEVKTTRRLDAASRACYQALRGVVVDDDGPPRSFYAHHQWQLWAMVECVRDECRVPVAGACVLRTSPTGVDHYPLNPWFAANARRTRRLLLPTYAAAAAAAAAASSSSSST